MIQNLDGLNDPKSKPTYIEYLSENTEDTPFFTERLTCYKIKSTRPETKKPFKY